MAVNSVQHVFNAIITLTSGILEDRHGREYFISDMNQYYIQVAYKRAGMVEKILSVI